MKISKDSILRENINHYLDINNININVADMLNIAFSYTDIVNAEEALKNRQDEEVTIIEALYEFYQLDKDNKDNQTIMEEYFLDNLKRLEPEEYLNNKYAQTIKSTGKYHGYALKMIEYAPYQLFPYDEIKVTSDYKEYSAIGYFNQPFAYLALTQGNNIWMSLNPNEIETMKPFIKKGRGRVLVLGLGLGYVPFMLALKDDVESIVVVEKDQDIIDLFDKLLYPSFINKEKIVVIKDDAINYVKNHQKFDYIFADLWHNPEDGLDLFIKLKRINLRIDCWLETSLIALLRRCMLTLIEETINGSKEEDYQHAKTITDKVINTYYHKTKNFDIININDLNDLLKEKNLLRFLI